MDEESELLSLLSLLTSITAWPPAGFALDWPGSFACDWGLRDWPCWDSLSPCLCLALKFKSYIINTPNCQQTTAHGFLLPGVDDLEEAKLLQIAHNTVAWRSWLCLLISCWQLKPDHVWNILQCLGLTCWQLNSYNSLVIWHVLEIRCRHSNPDNSLIMYTGNVLYLIINNMSGTSRECVDHISRVPQDCLPAITPSNPNISSNATAIHTIHQLEHFNVEKNHW